MPKCHIHQFLISHLGVLVLNPLFSKLKLLFYFEQKSDKTDKTNLFMKVVSKKIAVY